MLYDVPPAPKIYNIAPAVYLVLITTSNGSSKAAHESFVISQRG